MTDPGTDPEEVIRQSYRELTGSVPGGIERRLELAAATERLGSVAAVEAMRRALIMDNPLGLKHGQIVHFTQLVGLGKGGPARLHARAAQRARSTLPKLMGAVELALITSGVPAYSLGVEVLSKLLIEERTAPDGELPGAN